MAPELIQIDESTGCMYRIFDGQQEWYNPPMEAGIEYRTTERWQGKPVYTMTAHHTAAINQYGMVDTWIMDTTDDQGLYVFDIQSVICDSAHGAPAFTHANENEYISTGVSFIHEYDYVSWYICTQTKKDLLGEILATTVIKYIKNN